MIHFKIYAVFLPHAYRYGASHTDGMVPLFECTIPDYDLEKLKTAGVITGHEPFDRKKRDSDTIPKKRDLAKEEDALSKWHAVWSKEEEALRKRDPGYYAFLRKYRREQK